jgi:hypothetical protein
VDAEVLPALDGLVMPLVVHPVPMQDLSVSAIRCLAGSALLPWPML